MDPLLKSKPTLTLNSTDGGAENDLQNEKVRIPTQSKGLQMKQTEEEEDCKIIIMLIS